MSEENGLPPPCLGDLVRDWLREEPSLDKHFFVHKQEVDWFIVRLMCDSGRAAIATHYYDFPNHWYFLTGKTELSAADPEFFDKLENFLRRDHNKWNAECGVKL